MPFFFLRYRNLNLILLFLICGFASRAQSDCICADRDDLKKEFKNIRKEGDPQKAREFLDRIKKEGNTNCYLFSLNLVYNLLNDLHENDEGLILVTEGRKLFTRPCHDTLLAENYLWTGSYYMDKANSDSALAYFIKALELAQKIKVPDVQIKANGNISMVFVDLGQIEKALFYNLKAKDLAIKANDNNKVAIIYGNMASDYGQLYTNTAKNEYLDSALHCEEYSIRYARMVGNDIAIQFSYGTMAAIYIIKKNYKTAMQYCDSLGNMKGLIDQNRAILYTRRADIYKATGNTELALKYADSSYQFALIASPPPEVMSTMKGLVDAYKLSGNTSKAMEMMEKLMQFKDSLSNVETTARVSELEQKYNKSENEKKINELNKENEIASLNVKFLAVGVLAAILIIIVIVFFYRQSVLKNKFKALETEQRLNRARMNPHFFFNALASIQTLAMDLENNSKVPVMISKFSKIMRQSLESTYDELVTIENEIIFLTNYLDVQKIRFNNKFDYEIFVDEDLAQDELMVPGMLLQPFIENSIEHGFKNVDYKGKLDVIFKKEVNGLKIQLKDNGKGFDSTKGHKEYPSRATQIVNDRLMILNKQHRSNASYSLKDNPAGKGVCVEVNLPLIH